MARASNKAPASGDGHDIAEDASAAGVANGVAVDATRALLSHPLGAAQDAVHALLQLQVQQARALRNWAQAVDEAARDAQRAPDLPGLMAVVLNLTGRQVSLASAQWAEGWSQWLEGGVQLADRVRGEAVTLASDLQPPAAAAVQRGEAAALLDSWSRMQEQWRETLQRWMDAAQAGPAPAPPTPR